MAAAQMNANQDNILLDLKELKKSIAERCRTWFSDLMVMDGEVRDRTILVKVHCMIYPISDLVVYQVFSEVGLVEDVSYISAESGFHYRVRFRDTYSANWALNYFNGRWIFEGSCRFEVLMVNDVMNSHVQKVFDEFRKTMHKESPKIDEVRRQTEESVQEGDPKGFKALNQEEEVVQVEIKNESIVAKESINPTACQVFDELPMPFDNGIELLGASPKEFEVLFDDTLDQEAPPLSSDEEKDGSNSKVFEVCKAETELLDELDMKIGHERALCFDPGGGSMKLVGDSLDLRCCDKKVICEIYLCGSGTDQSTLHASKSDQAKARSETLLFDPGGEALLLGGDFHDVGAALAGRRYWKCTHVDLSDNADLIHTYWIGYGVYQSHFLALVPQKLKVNSQLEWLVFDNLDIDNLFTQEDSANEYGGSLPFDPGGGAWSLNQELVTREKNYLWVTNEKWTEMADLFISPSGIIMNQTAWVASKIEQAKVLIFDPGGTRIIVVASDFFSARWVTFWDDYTTRGFDAQFSFDSGGECLMLAGTCVENMIFDPGGNEMEPDLEVAYVTYVNGHDTDVSRIMYVIIFSISPTLSPHLDSYSERIGMWCNVYWHYESLVMPSSKWQVFEGPYRVTDHGNFFLTWSHGLILKSMVATLFHGFVFIYVAEFYGHGRIYKMLHLESFCPKKKFNADFIVSATQLEVELPFRTVLMMGGDVMTSSLTCPLQTLVMVWLGTTAATNHHCVCCHILLFYELVIDDP